MAEFEYLILKYTRYRDSLTGALTVYQTRASTQAIIQSAEEAPKSFKDQRSNEKLSQQMFEIVLKNRLGKCYLRSIYSLTIVGYVNIPPSNNSPAAVWEKEITKQS